MTNQKCTLISYTDYNNYSVNYSESESESEYEDQSEPESETYIDLDDSFLKDFIKYRQFLRRLSSQDLFVQHEYS